MRSTVSSVKTSISEPAFEKLILIIGELIAIVAAGYNLPAKMLNITTTPGALGTLLAV